MSIKTADLVRGVDGVDAVVACGDDADGRPGADRHDGRPADDHRASLAGSDKGRETFPVHYAQGRALTPRMRAGSSPSSGPTSPRKYDKHVGDTMSLHGVTSRSSACSADLDGARPGRRGAAPGRPASVLRIAAADGPGGLDPSDLVTTMTVYPKPGVDPEVLADRIEAQVPNVAAMTGKDFDAQIGAATSILNSILVGIALISLAVGGLSVVNTMAMSIAERTREIGIKRAIGGSRSRIVRELVGEAALIGFLGGTIGLLLGMLVVTLANEAGRSSGTVLFEMTPGTAVAAVLFATVLGALAGFFPAVHAARLDPVTALRYE